MEEQEIQTTEWLNYVAVSYQALFCQLAMNFFSGSTRIFQSVRKASDCSMQTQVSCFALNHKRVTREIL